MLFNQVPPLGGCWPTVEWREPSHVLSEQAFVQSTTVRWFAGTLLR